MKYKSTLSTSKIQVYKTKEKKNSFIISNCSYHKPITLLIFKYH